MLVLIGYALALCVGLSLGLMGSGGTILTLPVLVYIFRMNPVIGTSYSMFIVGITSLVGLTAQIRRHQVDMRAALGFAIPSLTAVFLVRRYVIHELPESISLPFGIQEPRDGLIMILFGLIMLAAALSMLLKKPSVNCDQKFATPDTNSPEHSGDKSSSKKLGLVRIGIEGLLVGSMTGLVGAGGGFLIIPAIVLVAGLPMATAVGTSLAIITAQSLLGFATDWSLVGEIDWAFLAKFSGVSIAGVLVGGYLGRFCHGESLKRIFGWFTLIVALVILGKELIGRGLF